jgi:hypothetical protein
MLVGLPRSPLAVFAFSFGATLTMAPAICGLRWPFVVAGLIVGTAFGGWAGALCVLAGQQAQAGYQGGLKSSPASDANPYQSPRESQVLER